MTLWEELVSCAATMGALSCAALGPLGPGCQLKIQSSNDSCCVMMNKHRVAGRHSSVRMRMTRRVPLLLVLAESIFSVSDSAVSLRLSLLARRRPQQTRRAVRYSTSKGSAKIAGQSERSTTQRRSSLVALHATQQSVSLSSSLLLANPTSILPPNPIS